MPKRSGTVLRTKKYERFRGVDFSTDPALVDDTRSPWAPNMIADRGGMPEKRPGWRTLEQFGARVNGIFGTTRAARRSTSAGACGSSRGTGCTAMTARRRETPWRTPTRR